MAPDGSRVGSYVSSWPGFRTSSYWIEGPTGLILIDTQFLLSAAEEMVSFAEKVTGKKAVMAIILHPNPDKFNGTSVFQRRGIKVITSEQVVQKIPAVHQLRLKWFYDDFKPDYPLEQPQPESFGSKTQEIEAAGLKLKLHVMGAGCSEAHVVVQYEDHVFVGDLVTQGFHSWLELGLLQEWMKRLDEVEAMEPEFVHTGRGGTGDAKLIRQEKKYLRDVIEIVRKYKPGPGRKLTPPMVDQIQSDIESAYPWYDYPRFISNGIQAVWKNLSEGGKTAPSRGERRRGGGGN